MYGIFYYDSVAVPPRQEFRAFMSSVQEYVHTHVHPQSKRHFCKQYNKHKRQFKNTECGVFSMLFGIECITKRMHSNFRTICSEIKDDDHTHKYRDILYTPL
jgi:hypothetical protein